jgi:hypothetical protein
MALKKTDDKKQKGLRGIWNRTKEPDAYTDNSMRDAVKKGASWGGGIPAGMCGLVAAFVSIAYPLDQWGNISAVDYNMSVDSSFMQQHEHIGMSFHDQNIYIVKDNEHAQDQWRVYKVERGDSSDAEYTELTLIEDPNAAQRIVQAAVEFNAAELEHVENHTYFIPSSYYQADQITVPFLDDGETQRLTISTSSVMQVGDNLMTEYTQVGAFLNEANEALSGQTVSGYGFTASEEISENAPEVNMPEVLAMLAAVWGSTLAAGVVGGTLGGSTGAAIETGRRISTRRKYKKRGWKP